LQLEGLLLVDEDLSKLKIDKSPAAFRAGRRGKRLTLFTAISVVVLVLIGVLYLAGILTPAVSVEVANVVEMYPSQAFTLLDASGYVVAQRKAAVASKVTGLLTSISVEEGNRVKKGQIIAQLENNDVVAAKRQAEANLNVARHNLEQARAELQDATLSFDRNKELLARDFVSKAEYDASEARYKRAVAAVDGSEAAVKANEAALQAANVAIEYTLIRAPFDAVVLTKDADVGDIVTPIGAAAEAKAAVVTIADMKSLQVEVDVAESNIGVVKVGQPCEIQLDALPDSRFPGKVHMIVPTADRSKATVLVKVRFLNIDDRILPEMSAKVAFLSRPIKPGEEKPRTVINPAAIVVRNGKNVVYIVKGNRVAETPITVGEHLGDMVEVIEGVKAGDRAVVKTPERLKDGFRIKIIEK
jgi:RND family efflux transporter MFP subunit